MCATILSSYPPSPLPFLSAVLHLCCWLPSSLPVTCILLSFLVLLSLANPPPMQSFLCFFFYTAFCVYPLVKFINYVVLLLISLVFFNHWETYLNICQCDIMWLFHLVNFCSFLCNLKPYYCKVSVNLVCCSLIN